MTRFRLQHAWSGGRVVDDLLVTVDDGRFSEVRPATSGDDGVRLEGLTVPGFANVHSHAFHRLLRATSQQDASGCGSFWTWREQMYAQAERLEPDTLYACCRDVYAEMVTAGYTSVGEFHYLHHDRDGRPYSAVGEPHAMELAAIRAARDVGLRITLLDTCYLTAGMGRAPQGVQRRFSDGDAAAWATRVDGLAGRPEVRVDDGVVLGAAIHSVRAVPADQLGVVASWARDHGAPLHVHVSEQPAENDECMAAYGTTPTQLLAAHGALGPRTTFVHATHLTEADVTGIGHAGSYACFCPTTERDLADGVGPSTALRGAGARLCFGSDSQAVIDPYEELRAVELNHRLVSGVRGSWSSEALLWAGTAEGHAALGFGDAGRIAVGCRADLVTLDLDSMRTRGCGPTPQTAVFAATAADVTSVIVDGRPRVGSAV